MDFIVESGNAREDSWLEVSQIFFNFKQVSAIEANAGTLVEHNAHDRFFVNVSQRQVRKVAICVSNLNIF